MDTSVLGEQESPLAPNIRGLQSNARAAVAYKRQHGSGSLSLNAATGIQYYPEIGRLLSVNHSVSGAFRTTLGRHTSIQVQHAVHRSPFYMISFLGQMPGYEPLSSDGDYAAFHWNNVSQSGAIAVTQEIGRRSSVVVNYDIQTTAVQDATFAAHGAGASYRYRVNTYATARLGYSQRRMGRQSTLHAMEPRTGRSHDLDLGVDYSRPLSLSRRTTLAFRSGTSMVPANEGAQVHVTGGVALVREIGRTWTAGADYGRNLEFSQTLGEPVLSDSLSLHVRGTPTRRLNLTMSATSTMGRIGFGGGDRNYLARLAALRARWTVNRFVALYGDSTYYHHDFAGAVQTAPDLRRHVYRREVRVGVTTSIPLLR